MREDARAAPAGRLTKRKDFVAAASGRRFHTERMTVQGRRRDDSGGLRIGLTVTRRVGHATERNRIKRRLRAATHLAVARDAAAAPGKAGHESFAGIAADVVVIARRPVLSADFGLLVEDVVRALHKVTQPGRPGEPKGSTRRSAPDHRAGGRASGPSPSSPAEVADSPHDERGQS